MDGLTAKVFRTYNASITLQQQLKELSCCESLRLQSVSQSVTRSRTDTDVNYKHSHNFPQSS